MNRGSHMYEFVAEKDSCIRDQSIWERLESLSKDDLIVELVYWRNMYGIVRVEDDDEHCPWPCV